MEARHDGIFYGTQPDVVGEVADVNGRYGTLCGRSRTWCEAFARSSQLRVACRGRHSVRWGINFLIPAPGWISDKLEQSIPAPCRRRHPCGVYPS